MSRAILVVSCLSTLLLGTAATAQDSPSPRRSLAACMTKRMVADRTVSYNEAQRQCKEQGKGTDEKPQTAANAQSKPVS